MCCKYTNIFVKNWFADLLYATFIFQYDMQESTTFKGKDLLLQHMQKVHYGLAEVIDLVEPTLTGE